MSPRARLLALTLSLAGASFFVPTLAAAAPASGSTSATMSAAEDGDAEVRTLWSDGGELLVAGGRESLLLYGRNGEEQAREAVEVESFVDAAGTRAGGNFAVRPPRFVVDGEGPVRF